MAKKIILILDDSASMRALISIALSGAGFMVIEAKNGVEGLTKLGGLRIHLIISDLNMPEMDGLTFLSKLKEQPALRYIPFIMLTTESTEDRKQQGKKAGANAWLVKPFEPALLIDTVLKLVQP